MAHPKKTPAKSTSSATSLSPILQKLFVGSVGLLFVMQVVQSCYYLSQQLPYNPNVSSYVMWFVGVVIAMTIWLVVYLSRRTRTLTLRTVFDVTLVSLSAILIATSLGWFVTLMQLPYGDVPQDLQFYIALYQALPFAFTVPLLIS